METTATIGIDTGGTFTDLVLIDGASGEQWFYKTPTTPDDASRGILEGIRALLSLAARAPGTVIGLCHGTTLATNAVLERKWARTGMIATAGFGDVIELARQRRPSFFNLDIEKPVPPATRDLRFEVAGRIAHDGTEITPLDEDGVRSAAQAMKTLGVEAVAICFMHSYANPLHERRAAEIVRQVWPDAFVCSSAEILAEFREYERFATASVNASLLPVIDGYLTKFERGVKDLGIRIEPRIIQSNGGAVSPTTVRRAPINTFFSGPAGGVIGAVALGAAADVRNIITFDMGGTSTDVALIRDGVPAKHNVREMGGFPVRTRTLDIHTIGAGGGSIAYVDAGGLLKVGPRSAGAMPGPACYGRGGELPTVTDANMFLGRLNPVALLQGRMPVYPDRARRAIEEHLCQKLGMDPVRVASGIVEIVNANMMGAVKVISVERGEDPRAFALMPFGGAGPLHAAEVAVMIGMDKVFVPRRAGLLSAMGLVHADARGDFSLTRLVIASAGALAELNDGLRNLDERAAGWLEDETSDGVAQYEWSADMRYFGQNFELPIPLDIGRLDEAALATLCRKFEEAHSAAYGYAMPGRAIEIVNLRLGVVILRAALPLGEALPETSPSDALIGERSVWFPLTGFVPTRIYDREKLPGSAVFAGPAIVEQMDTTTVVPPASRVEVDRLGNLMIHLLSAKSGRSQ